MECRMNNKVSILEDLLVEVFKYNPGAEYSE